MLNRDNWGSRARFGMFIVSSEAVPEAEWWAMLPPDTSVHAARINSTAPWAAWCDNNHSKVTLAADLARGAAQFACMRLNTVVVGHSSSSFVGGPGWDETVVEALHNILPATVHITTNGLDCVAALTASGIERPFIVFPPWFNETLIDTGVNYFTSRGFAPVGSLSADPGPKWQGVPPGELYPQGMGFEQDVELLGKEILTACPVDADGVLIAGTGFRCVGICEALEKALDRPVITANQASLWRCLRMAGVNDKVSGYGRLLKLV